MEQPPSRYVVRDCRAKPSFPKMAVAEDWLIDYRLAARRGAMLQVTNREQYQLCRHNLNRRIIRLFSELRHYVDTSGDSGWIGNSACRPGWTGRSMPNVGCPSGRQQAVSRGLGDPIPTERIGPVRWSCANITPASEICWTPTASDDPRKLPLRRRRRVPRP